MKSIKRYVIIKNVGMEAGEKPARARRRDAQKAPFCPKPQFGDKPLGDREGEGSAQSRNTFRKKKYPQEREGRFGETN